MKKTALLLLAASCLPACAQTWVKLGIDGIKVQGTAGMTLRYGAVAGPQADVCDGKTVVPEGWVSKTLTADATFTAGQDWFGSDPAYCRYKGVEILKTAVEQKLTVNGVTVIVPALPPPVTVMSSWLLVGCVIDFNSDGTAHIRSGCVVEKK
jgi:hypothetical protein